MSDYVNIMDRICNSVWLIEPDSLNNILSIMDRKIKGEAIDLSDYAFGSPPRGNEVVEEQPNSGVGMLNIMGPLLPRAGLMAQMSGATSTEQMRAQFNEMVNDDNIKSIVLNIDSPGGVSDLIMEFGDDIYNARGSKPIVAVSNTTAASAAYWLGSQAEKFYVTPSGLVGSIGVYTVHQDKSAQQEKEGVSTTLISAGKYKTEGNPFGPLTDETKAHVQDRVNETYDEFISAVARGRGVDDEVVKESYGEGRTYRAKTALAMNMVDGVQTLDSVVGGMMEYAGQSSGGGGSYVYYTNDTSNIADSIRAGLPFAIQPSEKKDGEKMEFTAETLAALGLSEDATTDEINAAVMEMVSEVTPLRNAVAKQLAFAEQFPEEAAMLADLRERNVEQSASLFSESYAKFSADSAHGFSAVALDLIADSHKKISANSFSHDDLKSFLDLFSDKAAIVDYTEHGTSREAELITAESSRDAATQLATLAHAAQAEAGGSSKLSWGDALAKVSSENPELVQMYHGSDGSDD